MSPFREVPWVELGPLEVGLAAAAKRAAARLPRGGRLLTASGAANGAYGSGALGSAGLVLVGATALAAMGTGWQLATIGDLAASVPVVVFGGLSLAAVFRASDRGARASARSGEVVGKKAGAVLRRLGRLEVHARSGRADPGRISALRRALATASDDAEISPWIPADVRGRAELLLAREIAASGGPSWPRRATSRREVRALLEAATRHLDEDAPARADLDVLDREGRAAAIVERGVPARRW
jgi:hypothetical protein